jgi:hypothetical protein
MEIGKGVCNEWISFAKLIFTLRLENDIQIHMLFRISDFMKASEAVCRRTVARTARNAASAIMRRFPKHSVKTDSRKTSPSHPCRSFDLLCFPCRMREQVRSVWSGRSAINYVRNTWVDLLFKPAAAA